MGKEKGQMNLLRQLATHTVFDTKLCSHACTAHADTDTDQKTEKLPAELMGNGVLRKTAMKSNEELYWK